MNTLRRVAVIDCGTNTFNLRIVDVGAEAGWIPVFGQRIPVKLGQGGVAKGVIRPDRIARGLDALVSMREAIRNYRVEEVHVMATSAMRDAKNGQDFVDQTKALTGFDIQVISGQHEARLIQEGIRLNFPEPPKETCLTMDIGGGSVEFIVWDAEGIKWAQSFDTGVARLHMLMNFPDPIGPEGVAKMRPYFDDVMAPLAAAIEALKPTLLVGASGSFDTIADLVGTRTRVERPDHAQSPEPHPGTDPVPLDAWADVFAQLTERDVHHRTNMPGMDPARVDLMPYSAALIQWVLDQGTVTSICRAPYALREGVLSRIEQSLPLLPEL
jgi:exopolyphosphatase/guanosine-5'-triphosphate,3'-diphosphate pyrophosphatase